MSRRLLQLTGTGRDHAEDAVAGATFAVVLALAMAAVSGVDRAVRPRVYTLLGGTAGFVAIQLGQPQPFGLSTVPVLTRPTRPWSS